MEIIDVAAHRLVMYLVQSRLGSCDQAEQCCPTDALDPAFLEPPHSSSFIRDWRE